jgi:hypothetical protein
VPNFPPYGYPIVSAQPETPDVREAPSRARLAGFPSRPQGTQSSLNRGRASISRGFRLSWSPCVIARGSAGRPGRHRRGLASFAPALAPSCIGAGDGSFSLGRASPGRERRRSHATSSTSRRRCARHGTTTSRSGTPTCSRLASRSRLRTTDRVPGFSHVGFGFADSRVRTMAVTAWAGGIHPHRTAPQGPRRRPDPPIGRRRGHPFIGRIVRERYVDVPGHRPRGDHRRAQASETVESMTDPSRSVVKSIDRTPFASSQRHSTAAAG